MEEKILFIRAIVRMQTLLVVLPSGRSQNEAHDIVGNAYGRGLWPDRVGKSRSYS